MLTGRTVLIVEAEFLVALDIQHMLEKLSAGPLLFARTASEAHAHQADGPAIDLAIVAFGRDSAQTRALLVALRARGVMILLCSSQGETELEDADLADIPLITKPIVEDDFRSAIAGLLAPTSRTSDCVS